ncbi:MAG: L,D-transpeptidase family protein [Thermoleophilaceae bacterium]
MPPSITSMVRASLVLIAALALAPAAHAAPPERLPADATIAQVAVGDLAPADAKRALKDSLGPVYEKRPVAIRVGHKDTLVMPTQAGLVIAYDWMVKRAFALAGAHKPVVVPLHLAVADAKLNAAVASVAKPFYRAPRDARVRFGVTAVRRVRARMGRALNEATVRKALDEELRRPTTGRVVRGKVVRVRPAVTTAGLRSRYPAYISVDRGTHTLRLFRALRLVRTYPVAVGASGFETPRGLRHVLYKDKNPSWTAPNRPWAYPYQGQTFPPGDSRNPLRAWFIALGDGIGIHGTSEEWTVGSSASHGCIRMHAQDVSRLAPLVPIGTPVLIH